MYSVVAAAWAMKHKNGMQISSKIYESLKAEFAHISSAAQTVIATVKNREGKILKVSIDDHRLKAHELVGIQKDKVTVKDGNGNTMSVTVDDPRYISGELVPFMNGKMFVKYNGKSIMIDAKDYDPGIHTFHKIGTITVKDERGNTFDVSVDDPRYKSRKLMPIHQDIAYGRDKNGNIVKTATGDERFKTGELIGNNRGKVWITNGSDNAMIREFDIIPDGFFTGKTQRKDIISVKDTIYINNGSINKRIKKSDLIPKGMIKGNVKPYKFITDGVVTKKISPDDHLPDSFRYGMAPKKRKKVVI